MKKVIINLDLSETSGFYCIPVVVLLYILAEFFNNCQRESCFPDCLKVSNVVFLFKNTGERFLALLVFFLWLAKSLKKF